MCAEKHSSKNVSSTKDHSRSSHKSQQHHRKRAQNVDSDSEEEESSEEEEEEGEEEGEEEEEQEEEEEDYAPQRGGTAAAAAAAAGGGRGGGDVKAQQQRAAASSASASPTDSGGDDKKYCICQQPSYGDMVGCDNEKCPYEWFHFSCQYKKFSDHAALRCFLRTPFLSCMQTRIFQHGADACMAISTLRSVSVCSGVGLKKHPKGDWVCDECKSKMET